MRLDAKLETVRRENSVAVDWHDCAWHPQIIMQTPPPISRRGTKRLPASPSVLHTARCNLNHSKTMKTISFPSRRQWAGFTLIELLVVISIIGILAGLLLPVMALVKVRAQKAKARLEIQDLVTAIQNYDSTYGRFPVSSGVQSAANGTNDFTYGGTLLIQTSPNGLGPGIWSTNNSEVIAILMDITNYPDGSGATANVNYQKNPQQTAFLNAKMSGDNISSGVGTDLVYRDPWGNPYIITMDLNYDENCKDAFYSSTVVSGGGSNNNPGINGLINPDTTQNNNFQFHGKVMVWSAGPDKKIDTGSTANIGANKDNVFSWQ
ncbi:MAG TPA: type II secretion system protein [Verrucomicrobiae bacterium]|jgi:prepilin-type N-terminal cleavage/methylation domain-containing protein|nr:type II secretion system protein [Verrucomicrobiae bacterium]